MTYTNHEKEVIWNWVKSIGAQTILDKGIVFGYEYAPGQLLQGSEVFDNLYDYDRWQTLQQLCKVEIPIDAARKLLAVFAENDIEIFELKEAES